MLGLYFPPVFSGSPILTLSTPDDHFAVIPNCRLVCSGTRRVTCASGHPTIRAGIISPTGVQNVARIKIDATPNNHFAAGPYCRMAVSGFGSTGNAGSCPTICSQIISPTGVHVSRHDQCHPKRSFRCQSKPPCEWLAHSVRSSCWLVSNCPCRDCICRRCSTAS